MTAATSVGNGPLVPDNRARETMRALIYRAVHVEKRFKLTELSIASGVPYDTLSSYLTQRAEAARQPSLGNALSIAVVLGERAVNTLLSDLIGYGDARPLDEERALEPVVQGADALAHLATFIQAAATGSRASCETPEVRQAVDIVISDCLPWSSVGRAA